MPFCCSSLASKLFSSPMRSVIILPTSPRSLVDTLARAASEKSPIFFWQAEPYCSTCWLLVMSIFCAKASTMAFSSAVSLTSSGAGAGSGFFSSAGAASSTGSSVRVGVAGASRSKLKVLFSAMGIPSFPNLRVKGLVPLTCFAKPSGLPRGPCSQRHTGRPAGFQRPWQWMPRCVPLRYGWRRRSRP